jgi:hypothetical protein
MFSMWFKVSGAIMEGGSKERSNRRVDGRKVNARAQGENYSGAELYFGNADLNSQTALILIDPHRILD